MMLSHIKAMSLNICPLLQNLRILLYILGTLIPVLSISDNLPSVNHSQVSIPPIKPPLPHMTANSRSERVGLGSWLKSSKSSIDVINLGGNVFVDALFDISKAGTEDGCFERYLRITMTASKLEQWLEQWKNKYRIVGV